MAVEIYSALDAMAEIDGRFSGVASCGPAKAKAIAEHCKSAYGVELTPHQGMAFYNVVVELYDRLKKNEAESIRNALGSPDSTESTPTNGPEAS